MKISDYICSCTQEQFNGRRVVFWGYCEHNKLIKNEISKQGIEVEFFVDSSIAKQKIENVFSPQILENKSDEYYIVIPMTNHQDIIEIINHMGYTSKDYTYLGNIEYKIIHNDKDYYEDSYGNMIIGNVDRNRINFRGFNSKVIIHDRCKINEGFYLEIRDESKFEIGSDTRLNCRFEIYDKCSFECGKKCVFSSDGLIYMFESEIRIGDYFTIENGYTIRTLRKSFIEIGNDCMISYNINMRTNDGHSIFDIHTGNNINSTDELNKKRYIKLGDHVWIGTNALIMYGTDIGSGSIIGAMSMVRSKIPNNCIAAGIPAKVIRKDIAWSRNNNSEDINECNPEYINLTSLLDE